MKKSFHVFFLFTLLAFFATMANAGQVTLQTGEDGQYVNLPVTGTDTLVIPSDYTEGGSFKVYDDGGVDGNYSDLADGALALTAPDGYAFWITGGVDTEKNYDSLNIYKGDPEDDILIMEGIQGFIDDFYAIAVGPTIVLKFQSDGSYTEAGFDFDVQLVESSTEKTVSINNVDGGTVTSNIDNAESLVAMGDVVTLTATPDAGYVLSGIEVKDSDNKPVKVTGGFWYSNNTAMFIMPPKNVTVTPVFEETNLPFINMPVDGEKTISIPPGVTSFKVYDDGGKNGNPSPNAYGYLILNAPEGHLFQITGTLNIGSNSEFGIGEEDEGEYNILLDETNGENIDIGSIVSTKSSIGLYFEVGYEELLSGLDLTITVFDPSAPLTVTLNDGGHGTVEADNLTPVGGETVTLTATPDPNYILTGIEVRGVYDHQPVEVEGGFWHTGNSATFVMPQKDVEVTPVFGPASEAYINMPTTGTVMVDVPSGLNSFKVYDDGGKDGNYSSDANGYMVITAPAGYIFEISGTANTKLFDAYLDIYDGNMETAIMSGIEGETVIEPVLSGSGVVSLHFRNNYYPTRSGFELTVELGEAAESHSIAIHNEIGGTVTANKELAYVGDDISLGVNLRGDSLLNKLNVVRSDGKAVNVQWGTWYSMNTATFTMPYADVEVTPDYASGPTADDGLYAKIPTNSRSVDVNIPQNVTSFKVYQENFENYGSGQLVLNAPEGSLITVSGMDKDNFQSSLSIVEGGENGEEEVNLWGGEDCACPNELMSTGNKLKLRLNSGDPSALLDLTVEIYNPNLPHAIADADGIVNGSINADTRSAKMDDIVTLTATPADGYLLQEIQVADAEGNAIEVNGGSWATENTATFVMPYSNVTIKPIFTNAHTAAGGLYVNMPNNTKITLMIPEGVTSFKVYDDGGAGEDVHETYNAPGHDTLTLKAPEGYFLKVSGNVKKKGTITQAKFVVFNGDVHSDTLYKIHSDPAFNINFDPVTSLGSEMTLYLFGSLYNTHVSSYIDMNLTVELVPTTQYAAISTVNVGGRNIAVIDGAYNGAGQINITSEIPVDTVVLNRKFNHQTGYSTIVLPFNINGSRIDGLRQVVAFDGIGINEQTGKKQVEMVRVWCQNDVAAECSELSGDLRANTPYVVQMAGTSLVFHNSVTLQPTAEPVAKVGEWEFRGTLGKVQWNEGHGDLGKVYGFAAGSGEGVSPGQFVKAAAGAWIGALRAYIIKNPSSKARGYGASASAVSVDASIPDEMDVVIVDRPKDGGEEQTTVIGRINTRTGEFMMERDYDLKGRKLNGKPTARGAYYGKMKIVK